MYTLKIAWTLHEFDPNSPGELADEATLFIPADLVKVMNSYDGEKGKELVSQWVEAGSSLFDYSSVRRNRGDQTQATYYDTSRLIEVERNGQSTWYLASRAWILGPDGGTIERVAP